MRKPSRILLTLALVAAAIPLTALVVLRPTPARALDNGVGRTPPLGWNDWNTFGCAVSDSLIRQIADAMVSSGMAAAGYQYINIDDCWSTMSRDSSGNLVPDPNKFPNGMKSLADYVHSKGLKFGIYGEAGTTTCSGYPGSLGHEPQDAKLFASWGVDYLKYDNCGDHGGLTTQQRYNAMRDALLATGRPIFYNLCLWGADSVWTWGAQTGNSWRTTGDIAANWGSVMGILDSQVGLETYAGPGGWNDPDMLEVGVGSMTDAESQAHFSLWALLNAPLIAGNDLRTMSASTKAILTNTDVIAVNQDWGGKAGYKVRDDGDVEVWAKPMFNGSVAVVLLNRGGSTATISTTASQIGLASASSYSLKDLWTKTTTQSSGTISASVPSHGATMYLVSGGGLPSQSPSRSASSSPSPSRSLSPSRSPSTSPSSSVSPSASRSVSPSVSRSVTQSASPSGNTASCSATYRVLNSWPGGFQGDVAVANNGARAITNWTVNWTFANGQVISQLWNGAATQNGSAVTVNNASWNGGLSQGGSTTFGFIAGWNGTNATPTNVTCTPA